MGGVSRMTGAVRFLCDTNATARGECARACTVGAFYQLHATLLKTLELDLYDTRKGAFGCCHRFDLISYQIASCSTRGSTCFAAWAHGLAREWTHIRCPIRR